MNIYGEYKLKDETENPFEPNDNSNSIELNEKKKRDISKIDIAEDSKEIKRRFVYFLKKSITELLRFPEDVTGWTRYLTLFTFLMFFLYPHPLLILILFIYTEPVLIYKALYRKNPTFTLIGTGTQIVLLGFYVFKAKLEGDFYNSFMIYITGTSLTLLMIMYFFSSLYCIKYDKKIEIENQIRKAENDEIKEIARRVAEDEFNKQMKEKYFEGRIYSQKSNFSQGIETDSLSDINENFSKQKQNSDINYFNTESKVSTNSDPDSIDVPDISCLEKL